MPNRTRADIQAEIEALQAELDAAQPDLLTIESSICRTPVTFGHLDYAPGISIVCSDPAAGYYDLSAVATLRDWLNHHFPKENA